MTTTRALSSAPASCWQLYRSTRQAADGAITVIARERDRRDSLFSFADLRSRTPATAALADDSTPALRTVYCEGET
jgi:hypothetical protein